MRTEIVKWLSIAALMLAMAFWKSAAGYQFALNLVVSMGAGVVAVQAFRAGRRGWAYGFLGLAAAFNPAIPFFLLPGRLGLAMVAAAAATFAISVIALKPQPLLSIPSITDRTPGSQSL